jgi:hypothetical protein
MWIVAVGAVHDDPTTPPTAQTFSVGATCPILSLFEVTLTAELIDLIHIHCRAILQTKRL